MKSIRTARAEAARGSFWNRRNRMKPKSGYSRGRKAPARDCIATDIKSDMDRMDMEEKSISKGNKKKKLLLITPMLHQGGFERVCVRTARLLEPWYDITIAIFDSADIAFDITGLRVADLKLGVQSGKIGKAVNVLRRIRALKKLKRQERIEISYSFGQTANLVNCLSRAGDRILCGIRSYQDFDNPEKIRLFCRKADEIVCCSADMEQMIREEYNCRKAWTLNNPINLNKVKKETGQQLCSDPDQQDILKKLETFREIHPELIVSMGRQDDIKGFWHLVKAVSICRQKASAEGKSKAGQIGLVILGEGDFSEYEQLAAELGIGKDCLFPGVLKEPFSFLATARVYALTSLKEGFPNSLVEAMAAGLPVISTDCRTGPAEILKPTDCGILIAPLEENKNMSAQELQEGDYRLAGQLLRLLEDEQLRQSYIEKGKERALFFSDENYIANCRKHLGN